MPSVRTLIALLVLLPLAAPALAKKGDPTDDAALEKARELARRAGIHYSLGKFNDAASEYEQVYELHPEASLLYNIGQCHRLGGDLDKALFFYRSYLRNEPRAKNAAEVQERIAELERVVAEKAKAQTKPPNSAEPLDKGEHVQPPPVGETPPPAGENPPVEAKKQPVETPREGTPIYKKWWLWTIVAAVVVVGVAVTVGVVVSSGSSGNGFMTNLPDSGPGVGALVRF
jgi:tetratricopeptide (TPR) repeat protein